MIKVQINVINRSCHRPGHWIQRADGPVAQNGRDYKDRRVGGAGAFHHFPKPQLIKQHIEAVYVMNVFQTIEMIHREPYMSNTHLSDRSDGDKKELPDG